MMGNEWNSMFSQTQGTKHGKSITTSTGMLYSREDGSSNTWKITNDWHTHTQESWFLKWTSKQIGHKSKKQQVIKHPLLSICFVSKCHVFVKTPNVSPRNQQTITNDVFPHKKNGSLPFLELTARTWKWMIGRLPPFWYVNSCFWFPW